MQTWYYFDINLSTVPHSWGKKWGETNFGNTVTKTIVNIISKFPLHISCNIHFYSIFGKWSKKAWILVFPGRFSTLRYISLRTCAAVCVAWLGLRVTTLAVGTIALSAIAGSGSHPPSSITGHIAITPLAPLVPIAIHCKKIPQCKKRYKDITSNTSQVTLHMPHSTQSFQESLNVTKSNLCFYHSNLNIM